MGKPQHLPHSLGGMSLVRLPKLVFVLARPSYRAAHWKRLFSLPLPVCGGLSHPCCRPGCADGDVPSAAHVNLYEGSRSHVSWHCDHEPLFGGIGDPKLIVSLKAKSCSDIEVSSCRLHHGDLLVMDGRCQDEYLHCTGPSLADKRMNITYRWVRYHTLSCPLATGVLGSLPACAQGSHLFWDLRSGDSNVPELVYLGLLGGFVLRIAR